MLKINFKSEIEEITKDLKALSAGADTVIEEFPELEDSVREIFDCFGSKMVNYVADQCMLHNLELDRLRMQASDSDLIKGL